MGLFSAIEVASSGMSAQSERLKTVSQNIANSESISTVQGGDPYRRRTVFFHNVYDDVVKAYLVRVSFGEDSADFKKKFDPASDAADQKGYVKLPNVNEVIESADFREAAIHYRANLGVLSASRDMLSTVIDFLGR